MLLTGRYLQYTVTHESASGWVIHVWDKTIYLYVKNWYTKSNQIKWNEWKWNFALNNWLHSKFCMVTTKKKGEHKSSVRRTDMIFSQQFIFYLAHSLALIHCWNRTKTITTHIHKSFKNTIFTQCKVITNDNIIWKWNNNNREKQMEMFSLD